jgi:2-phosphosulfolactate phosphatase
VYFDQTQFDLRCEWGLAGLQAVGADVDAIVIVDVLSFTTALDIAVSNGARVFPYRWKDDSAKAFALSRNAILAGNRREREAFSLAPASLRAIPAGTALVLPSPNGSTLSLHVKSVPTFAACLRNAPAVARQASLRGSRIAVIPAGERWSDDSLRPCVEDLVGAGAVLASLPGTMSPEAELAVAAFLACRDTLRERLSTCGSGRELIGRGFPEDIELAAEYAVSSAAPILLGECYVDDCPAR